MAIGFKFLIANAACGTYSPDLRGAFGFWGWSWSYNQNTACGGFFGATGY
jgi:hypothetical protein